MSHDRIACVCALTLAAWVGLTAPLAAQTTADPARQNGLEQRVRDLEEALRRLQAERDKGKATPEPVAAPGASAPGTSAGTRGQVVPVAATALQTGEPEQTPGPGEPGTTPESSEGTGGMSFDLGLSGTGPPSNAADAPKASPMQAYWNEGFYLRTADDQFQLRFTGQIQGDFRAFPDGHDTTDVDTFLLRRARFGIEADILKYYEFRLLPDFGQAEPIITDAFLNIHYRDEIQFEVGKFKQPFSYEQLIQDRYVPTVERSIVNQLTPARDEGVMLHGEKVFGDKFDWAVSVYNGETNGNLDTNNYKDAAARVAVRPFREAGVQEQTLLSDLEFGFAVTSGIEKEPLAPNTLRLPSTIPWLIYRTGVRADGIRDRYSPEFVYYFGPLGVLAQYYYETQQDSPSSTGTLANKIVHVPTEGGFVMATLFLTGEERRAYSELTRPVRPFDPSAPFTNPGAWELVGRTSRLEVGSDIFSGGSASLADPTKNSHGATETTLGFNWYLNSYVRMQFNYEHSWFDQPVTLGSGRDGKFTHDDALLTRFQIIW